MTDPNHALLIATLAGFFENHPFFWGVFVGILIVLVGQWFIPQK